jgi:hypothetical protein
LAGILLLTLSLGYFMLDGAIGQEQQRLKEAREAFAQGLGRGFFVGSCGVYCIH